MDLKETRKITTVVDFLTAEIWYESDNVFLKDMALSAFPELEKPILPKSWKELERVGGWFVDTAESVATETWIDGIPTYAKNKCIFFSKEQATASIALAQLSQLREVYRQGWKPDWTKTNTHYKYCIHSFNNVLKVYFCSDKNTFLAFQDYETAKLFLHNFKDLIELASPLLFG